MSLLLALNIFHKFFQCFCCWIWTGKCLKAFQYFAVEQNLGEYRNTVEHWYIMDYRNNFCQKNYLSEISDIYAKQSYLHDLHWLIITYNRPWNTQYNENRYRSARAEYSIWLTHSSPVLLFYTPWKHQKTFRFSDVFRGIEKQHRAMMG